MASASGAAYSVFDQTHFKHPLWLPLAEGWEMNVRASSPECACGWVFAEESVIDVLFI